MLVSSWMASIIFMQPAEILAKHPVVSGSSALLSRATVPDISPTYHRDEHFIYTTLSTATMIGPSMEKGNALLRAHDIALYMLQVVQLQYKTTIASGPANAHVFVVRPSFLYHLDTVSRSLYFSVSASTPLCHALGTIVSLSLTGALSLLTCSLACAALSVFAFTVSAESCP